VRFLINIVIDLDLYTSANRLRNWP